MISQKYNLKIGINTNCIEIDKLVDMINKGWINRVVIGMDYFDSDISKDSPIGESSMKILENALKIKKLGCDVSISSVYTNDLENKLKLIKWGIENNVRIKILEIVKNEKYNTTSSDFLNIEKIIKEKFNLKYIKDEYNEISGYLNNIKVITFFHSHCRIRECDICKKIHLRVTASGKMKQCIYNTDDDIDIRKAAFRENLIKYLNSPAKKY